MAYEQYQTYTPPDYYSNNAGNVYQVDPKTGQPVQVASGFDNSGAQAQPDVATQQTVQQPTQQAGQSQVAPFVKGQSPAQGAAGGMMSGAATGAAIGSVVPGVGTAIGAGVGAVVGGLAGGLTADEGEKTDAQRAADASAVRKEEAQGRLYNNRGADEVIGSIAQPGGPIIDSVRARMVKGEQLTPEEKKAIYMGGYGTVSQGAAREDQIYQNELKQMQRQQLFRQALGLGAVAVGGAALAKGVR